jgi:thiol-disulfide isomerase/thioredoxin
MMFLPILAQAPSLHLSLLPSGVFDKVHGYAPFGLKLSADKPKTLKMAPPALAPQYGTVKIGSHEFLLMLDGKDKIYVDSNGDGDLTNDPATTWAIKTYSNGTSAYEGSALVDLPFAGKTTPCKIGLYQTGPDAVGYYADFALYGRATFGAKTYDALYSDPSAVWDGKQGLLMLDLDANGQFSPRNEFNPVGRPFLIAGKTYEFGSLSGKPIVMSSTKKVTAYEEPADPNLANGLRRGKSALVFDATTLDGQKISFPKSYAGKVVMIDFWATWCNPCMREVPNVVKNFKAYRDKGFEVLGISLDREKSEDRVKDVTAKKEMTWPQVYDGNYFDAAIAKLYRIKSIPEAYLVDGDTGKILAGGEDIRGDKLGPAIERALAAKKR